MPSPYRICVVCSGNICRSPMAEIVLRGLFAEAGLADRVVVDSAGTKPWQAGNPADPRTVATLTRHGHDLGEADAHVARQIEAARLTGLDLVLVADRGHLAELTVLAESLSEGPRIELFRSFDPDADSPDMDDPWYGGDSDFERTYTEAVAAARGVVEWVRRELSTR